VRFASTFPFGVTKLTLSCSPTVPRAVGS
jgi:hypothetical protein